MVRAEQRIQKLTATSKIRGMVINSLYRKCSFKARSLSTAIDDMTRKETPAHIHDSEPDVVIFAMQKNRAFLFISNTICRA